MPKCAKDGLELKCSCEMPQGMQLSDRSALGTSSGKPLFAGVVNFDWMAEEMLEPYSGFLDWHLQPQ